MVVVFEKAVQLEVMTNSRLRAILLTSSKLLSLTNLLESDRILRQYIINMSITVVGGEEVRDINYYVHSIRNSAFALYS